MVRYYFGQNVGFVNNLVAKKAETSIFNYKIWIRRKDMFNSNQFYRVKTRDRPAKSKNLIEI